VYPTGDGGWLAVGAIEPVFWANLCRLLGLERWIEHQSDDAVQDEIRADIRAALAARSRDEWVALLADADTCVAPVLDIPEVVADPQVAARGAVIEARPPGDAEPFRQLAPLIAGAPRRDIYDLPDPTVTGTEVLLAAAGLSAEDIEALVARGVIA
jgi:alpha-methylacyl-CoA racemase